MLLFKGNPVGLGLQTVDTSSDWPEPPLREAWPWNDIPLAEGETDGHDAL